MGCSQETKHVAFAGQKLFSLSTTKQYTLQCILGYITLSLQCRQHVGARMLSKVSSVHCTLSVCTMQLKDAMLCTQYCSVECPVYTRQCPDAMCRQGYRWLHTTHWTSRSSCMHPPGFDSCEDVKSKKTGLCLCCFLRCFNTHLKSDALN